MIKSIDNWLNRITMYRLVLYYLIFLLGAAVTLSVVGILKFDVFALLHAESEFGAPIRGLCPGLTG